MTSDRELKRILNAQPLAQMQHFARELGWKGLRLEHACLSDDEASKAGVGSGVVIFYATTDPKFFLQINTWPHGQFGTHRATVRADRYGVFHVGWHEFVLHDDERLLAMEADRLKPWLFRRQFKDRKWRKVLAQQNPQLPILKSRRSSRRQT